MRTLHARRFKARADCIESKTQLSLLGDRELPKEL
jgi:hypothetical protein